MMKSFSQYLANYCIFPLFTCVLCLGILVDNVIFAYKYIHEKNVNIKNVFQTLISIVISLLLFVHSVIMPLGLRGILLMCEKESDAVEASGTIENVEVLDYRLYGTSDIYLFTINDVKYIAVLNRSESVPYATGDYVKVVYLPRSRYILAISNINVISSARAVLLSNTKLL